MKRYSIRLEGEVQRTETEIDISSNPTAPPETGPNRTRLIIVTELFSNFSTNVLISRPNSGLLNRQCFLYIPKNNNTLKTIRTHT